MTYSFVSIPAILTVATWLALPAQARDGDSIWFHTPSRNINCVGTTIDNVSYMNCTLLKISTLTVKGMNCDQERNIFFEVKKSGGAKPFCVDGDLGNIHAITLDYGKSVTFDAITCTASATGMECKNSQGHGYSLSKNAQRMF